jgi:pimeloyl-ACP methyl ester carboxylesterase
MVLRTVAAFVSGSDRRENDVDEYVMNGGLQDRIAAAMQRLLRFGHSAARSTFTTVGGQPVHHLDEGSGPPVVLLHGGTGGGANWFRLFHALAESHRVLAPDLPGFGLSASRSPRPPLGRQAAALMDEWLGTLGIEQATVVGTSFGGIAAARLALDAPARVARLLLLDAAGVGRALHPVLRFATLPLFRRFASQPTRNGTARTFRLLLTHERTSIPHEMQDALVDYLYLTALSAGASYLTRVLGLFAGPAGQREVLSPAELRRIAVPTTIALGEFDRFFSRAAAEDAAATVRDGRFLIIQRAGHSPNWERPDAVAAAILELIAR